MKPVYLLGLLIILAQVMMVRAAPIVSAEPVKLRNDMVLWYRQPGEKWLDAMPMGNGLIGAMVFGKTQNERIALNESSFWSGRPHDYDNPEALKYFPQIKELIAAGKFQDAEKMVDEHFFGVPAAQQAYQPIGDLLLTFDGAEKVEDYRRELNMETGVARVTFRAGDAVFTREIFVSYPDRVLVVRMTCDKPGRISVLAQLKSPFLDTVTVTTTDLVMDGTWKSGVAKKDWLVGEMEGKGLRFRTAMSVRLEGGKSVVAENAVQVKAADAVTLVLATATSYVNYQDITGDPAAMCTKTLAAAVGKDYATLLKRHVADFSGLMGRVHLAAGDAAANEKPIDERLKAYRAGTRDANLEALVFQFGRYILASASRPGGQPANLQGIWNEAVVPSWGSKYTININTEMNYWPAEVCNLSECHQPLFDMIKDISVTGAKTAKVYYGVDGWVTHHNIDLWRGTAPVDAARFGMWPVGGAWLCQHLWEHYAFTGDQAFLKENYPIMKGSAQFLLNILVEEPKHHWLVTPFSMSPEHGFIDGNGKPAVLSPGPTMDIAIMRELFPHCIEASRILGVDEDFRGKLEAALKKLPPYQINRLGHVQEWIEDWKAGDQGHNISPTFPFYPGCSITLRGEPELAMATQKWLESHASRGGFLISWDICLWARLEHGDKVASTMQTYIKNALAQNLHNNGANQSDATFGFTAGIAEALLQSHAGEISLLPALPEGWSDGSIEGLRARGGWVVDISWKNGKVESATLTHPAAASCKVRNGGKTAEFTVRPGETLRLNGDLVAVK